jgi:hypothetical protein
MSLDHLGFCIRKLADIDDKLSPEKQAVLKEKVRANLRRGGQRTAARPRPQIPWRENSLTNILMGALAGNTKTVLISAIRPGESRASAPRARPGPPRPRAAPCAQTSRSHWGRCASRRGAADAQWTCVRLR